MVDRTKEHDGILHDSDNWSRTTEVSRLSMIFAGNSRRHFVADALAMEQLPLVVGCGGYVKTLCT